MDSPINWQYVAGASVGPTGYTGSIGYTGSRGSGIIISGTLNNTGELPASGDFVGDAYNVNGTVYVWNGTQWILGGDFGPRGYTGSKGYDGASGYVGSKGDLGYTGSRGFTGSQGIQGVTGFVGSFGYTGSKRVS